jgi:oligopeptide transport system permease protein
LLLVIFSDVLNWFPGGGWGGISHLILPATALSLAPLAYILQLTRVSMLEVIGEDYVRTARAKGLSRSTVVWKHCLRNAILPVFTYLGPAAAAAMTGSFVVEYVFNIPGIGQHFVNGVKNRDQTLILGTVMVYSAFLLGLNLLVDIGYSFIDPRIQVDR